MFASRVTKEVEVDDGESLVKVTIQKLSARALDKAREAKSIAQLTAMRPASKDMWQGMRSAEMDRLADELKEKRANEAADPKARARARYDLHDREHVLQAGIVRWTSVTLLSEKALDDLDEATAQKLHEAILDLSLPPLDPVEAEAVLAKG